MEAQEVCGIAKRWQGALVLFAMLFVGCPHERKPDPDLTSVPPAPGPPPPAAGSSEFVTKVQKVRAVAPQLPQGSVMVAQWRNQRTGQSLVLVYQDETPPERKGEHWVIVSQASASNTVLSTIALGLPQIAPGRFSCNDGVMLGAALGSQWKPSDPESAWGSNEGGSCLVQLKPAAGNGLEGVFTGRLVANDGSGSYVIDQGYIYVKPPENENTCSSNDSECFFKLGVKCHNAGDFECAFKAFAVSCKQNVNTACFNLGVMYDNGKSIPQDYDKAFFFYNKACEMGSKKAAESYLKVLLKACETGNTDACGLAGMTMTQGKICGTFEMPPELSLGKKYLCRSCSAGGKAACALLERMELRCGR